MARQRRIMFAMHFFHEDVVGGAEVQSFLIARQLVANGHRVVYLCERIGKDRPSIETRDGVAVWRWMRYYPIFKILNLPIFLWALLRFRPDAIFHRYASQYTVFGAIARLFGIRYVYNCCEDKHLEPRYFRNELDRHFKTYRGNALKKSLLYADAWLCDVCYWLGVRFATATIAQNIAQQNGIRERFGKQATIICSGHAAHASNGAAQETPEILWLATYQSRKRPGLYLDVAERCVDLPARFVLAGRTANESFRQNLVDHSQRLPNVEMRHVDSYELSWNEFAHAYVYVCTSESEGFPNAFIQAWICGVPVVSLGVDPDNFIANNGVGYVCQSVDELEMRIRELVNDKEARNRIGEQARSVATRVFDIKKVTRDVEGVMFGGKITVEDTRDMEAVIEFIVSRRGNVADINSKSGYQNGGDAYDDRIIAAAAKIAQVRITHFRPAYMMGKRIPQFYPVSFYRTASPVVVKDAGTLAWRRQFAPIDICIVHHLDELANGGSLYARTFLKRLKKNLREQQHVVAVSKFWRDRFLEIGCRNVEIVYNSFDVELCRRLHVASRNELRKKLGLPSEVPVVYIGNASKLKGADRVAESLKASGYLLVYSGAAPLEGIAARFFNLPYEGYLELLGAADCVVCMSMQEEGWTRTAHEALLMNTPVVGSGVGGMMELLENAGQSICRSMEELPAAVDEVIHHPRDLSEHEREYVEGFTAERFESEWQRILRSLTR